MDTSIKTQNGFLYDNYTFSRLLFIYESKSQKWSFRHFHERVYCWLYRALLGLKSISPHYNKHVDVRAMGLRLGSDYKEVVSNSISFKKTVKLKRFTGLNKLCTKVEVADQCPFVYLKAWIWQHCLWGDYVKKVVKYLSCRLVCVNFQKNNLEIKV